jgi:N6-L-threonylcarbamoyladenine synthase
VFLGIDTSCYTTSLALVDDEKNLIDEKRMVLPVAIGTQGLRQSTALFYHLQNLPVAFHELFAAQKREEKIKAIAVSAAPSPRVDAYLPVFRAGLSVAESISACLGVPLVKTSHQEGHLAAGIWHCGEALGKEFLAFHLSGGTTELLLVRLHHVQPLRFEIKILGASQDIHAGQLVDRVGVALGFPFPAGQFLENLAAQALPERAGKSAGHSEMKKDSEKNELKIEVLIPSSVKGYQMSFSGAETRAKDMIKKGIAPWKIARAVENCLAATVEKVARKGISETGLTKVLFVGGVMSNQYLRHRLRKRLEHPAVGARLFFADPAYSSDNAAGVALVARSLFYPW